MERELYDQHRKMQETHWWFCGKKEIVIDFAEHQAGLMRSSSPMQILDIGCGMGLMLDALKLYGNVYGMDAEDVAVQYCRANNETIKDSIKLGALPNEVPFEKGTFDFIFALDVLEHVYDDESAMKTIFNLLKPGGKLVATVPALMSMWSAHDELNHHFRRYEKNEFYEKITGAGFKVLKMSFYNSLLFLPAYCVRKVKNAFKVKTSDISSE